MKFALLISCCVTTVCAHTQTLNNCSVGAAVESDTIVKPRHHIIKPETIAAGYAAFTLFTYRYLDDEIQEIAQSSQNKVVYNSLKTIGYAGLGTTNIAITAGTGLTGLITKNKRLEKAAILLTASHLINDFATHQLKVTFQRHRPSTGDSYKRFDWREGAKINESFVSNHTSNAFTTATVFVLCFPDKKWVPVVAYSTASIVGLSRIYQNAHWASDVLGGAAVGFLSAQLANKLYNMAGKRFTFLPEVSNRYYGMSVCYSLK
jgi:membrane-associated phospholipid phosphatase